MQTQQPDIYQTKSESNRIYDKLDLNLQKITDLCFGLNIMLEKHDMSIQHINTKLDERDIFYKEFFVQRLDDIDTDTKKEIDKLSQRITDNEKFKLKTLGITSIIPIMITVFPFIVKLFTG